MKLVSKRATALTAIFSLLVVMAFTFSAIGANAAGSTASVTLNSINGSKATGTGTITDNGDGTITVVINAKGLEPGDHIDHIHTGSCAAQGPVKYPLTNITADASGSGSSTTKVSVSYATVTAGGYYLNVHDLAKAGTTCGDITASASNAPAAPTTAAATSNGNPPSAAPATGLGGATNSEAGFPVGLGLISLLSLVVIGSGVALFRANTTR